MLFSFAKGIPLMTFCCYSNGDQFSVVAKLFCKTCEVVSYGLFVSVALLRGTYFIGLSVSPQNSWQWHYSPFSCSVGYKQLQRGHFLQANSSALQHRGDLKVPFPVKARVACAPKSFHSGASFFLLSYIPILRHPTKPQLNKEEHFAPAAC